MGILDKLMGRSDEHEYVDIDLGQFEEVSTDLSEIMVRMADLKDLDVLAGIKREVLGGNVVLVDISFMRQEKEMLDEAISELKATAEDVRGDIAGVGEDLVMIVPKGMRIDRDRILGAE